MNSCVHPPQHAPRVIFRTSTRCNYRCSMCFWSNPEVAAKLTKEDPVMSLELFERVINQAKKHAHKFGLTDSGEFMMDPLWTERLETISAIAKADPATMFHQITNASLLTKKTFANSPA